MKTKTTVSALFLLAIAAFTPACDVFNPIPCDPSQEIGPFPPPPDSIDAPNIGDPTGPIKTAR